jgi:hypothetical protein
MPWFFVLTDISTSSLVQVTHDAGTSAALSTGDDP